MSSVFIITFILGLLLLALSFYRAEYRQVKEEVNSWFLGQLWFT